MEELFGGGGSGREGGFSGGTVGSDGDDLGRGDGIVADGTAVYGIGVNGTVVYGTVVSGTNSNVLNV